MRGTVKLSETVVLITIVTDEDL